MLARRRRITSSRPRSEIRRRLDASAPSYVPRVEFNQRDFAPISLTIGGLPSETKPHLSETKRANT
ncbi:hypothetical protein C7S16_6026 [Burkholderia thailandensis]|uniref:Uncharacterized protein n=1 Tax=Burkholderia thailandensis TaxID=57975 RepID=A0AAW9CXR7_BURTH|nr:hypothetical protein [Burkholderia thailandensis]MDW9252564.1 hypothetical protein [Burkholderia thailandensis]